METYATILYHHLPDFDMLSPAAGGMTRCLKRFRPVFISVLFAASRMALAEDADAGTLQFDIRHFEIQGSRMLAQDEAHALLAPYAGKQKNFADIMDALQALESAYHARGYKLVRIDLPEQDLSRGVVSLEVIETRIGKVTIEGNQRFDDINIRQSLPALQEGTTPNLDQISRSLKLANENPSKKTVLAMKASDKDDEVDAALTVSEESIWRTNINLSNSGTSQTGRTYAGVVLQDANLFGRDHVASLQYTTTLEHPDQVAIYGLGYRLPLYASGDSVDVFHTYSDVNAGTVTAGALNLAVSGKGQVFGARYNFTLAPVGAYRSKLVLGFDYKAFANNVLLQGTDLGNDITVHPLSIGYEGSWVQTSGTASLALTALRNIPGGSNGGTADFIAARSGANADYAVMRASGAMTRQFPAGWQMNIAVNGQYTRDALVPGEQFGAGGATSVRGFDERKATNDNGLSANLELHAPSRSAGSDTVWRALAFFDAAHLWRNQALAGETSDTGISSVGVGARLQGSKHWSAQADYGHVLQTGALTGVSNNRWHIRAVLSF